MTVGLQTFYPTGRIQTDLTTHYARVFGYFDIPLFDWFHRPAEISTSGSVTESRFSLGTPFWTVESRSESMILYSTKYGNQAPGSEMHNLVYSMWGQYIEQHPDVWVSGTTLYWNYPDFVYVDDVLWWAVGGLRVHYGVM